MVGCAELSSQLWSCLVAPSVEWLRAKGAVVAGKKASPFGPSLTSPFVFSEFCLSPPSLTPFPVAGTPLFRELGELDRLCSCCTPMSLSVRSAKWKWSSQLSLPTGLVENHMLWQATWRCRGVWPSGAGTGRHESLEGSSGLAPPVVTLHSVIQSGQACFY